jgi:hypothetical protein
MLGSPLLVAGLTVTALAVWLALWWRRSREPQSEKRERWELLPLRFKLACWGVVTPLFVAAIVVPFLVPSRWGDALGLVAWFLALVGMIVLEIRAVAWYKLQGLLPTYNHDQAP